MEAYSHIGGNLIRSGIPQYRLCHEGPFAGTGIKEEKLGMYVINSRTTEAAAHAGARRVQGCVNFVKTDVDPTHGQICAIYRLL